MNTEKQKALGKAMLCELMLYCLYSLISVLVKKYIGEILYAFVSCILTALSFVLPTLLYVKTADIELSALIYPNERRTDTQGYIRLNTPLFFIIGLSITVSAVNVVSLGTECVFDLLGAKGSESAILSNTELIASFFRNVLISAAVEELLLRGVVLDSTRNLSNSKRILISSLLFALIHCNARSFFYAFAAGIVITGFTLMRNSVVFGFALHFSQNLITFIFALLSQTLNKSLYSAISEMCFILFLSVALIGITVFVVLRRKTNFESSSEPEKEKFFVSAEMKFFILCTALITAVTF